MRSVSFSWHGESSGWPQKAGSADGLEQPDEGSVSYGLGGWASGFVLST